MSNDQETDGVTVVHRKPSDMTSWFKALSRDLTVDFERAIKQRDEFLRTGVSTASHGGSHDTFTDYFLRTHLKKIGIDIPRD